MDTEKQAYQKEIKKWFPYYAKALHLPKDKYKCSLQDALLSFDPEKETYGSAIIDSMRRNLNQQITDGRIYVNESFKENVSNPKGIEKKELKSLQIFAENTLKSKQKEINGIQTLPVIAYNKKDETVYLFLDPKTSSIKQWNGKIEPPIHYKVKNGYVENKPVQGLFMNYGILLEQSLSRESTQESKLEEILQGYKNALSENYEKVEKKIASLDKTREAFAYAVEKLSRISQPVGNKRKCREMRENARKEIFKIRTEIRKNKDYRVDPSFEKHMNELFADAKTALHGKMRCVAYREEEKDGKKKYVKETGVGRVGFFGLDGAMGYFDYNINREKKIAEKRAKNYEKGILDVLSTSLAGYIFKEAIGADGQILTKNDITLAEEYIKPVVKGLKSGVLNDLLELDSTNLVQRLQEIKTKMLYKTNKNNNETQISDNLEALPLKREKFINEGNIPLQSEKNKSWDV